jgi:hypothetical protein
MQICEILTQYDERIKLVRHPDGMNVAQQQVAIWQAISE